MKAIIVAAGKGNRLLPLTKETPKPLLKINDETILEHQIGNLTSQGIDEIVMVTGYQAKKIEAAGGPDIRYIYNPFYEITNSLVSLWFARHEINGDFVYLHADVVFDRRILEKLICQPADFCLAVDKKSCVPEDMKVRVDGEQMVEISKNIDSHQAYGEFTGLAKCSKEGCKALTKVLDVMVREGELMLWFESAIQRLIDQGEKVYKCETEGWPWIEIDFVDDLEKAKTIFHQIMNNSPS